MTDTTDLITLPHKSEVPAMFADNGKKISELIDTIETEARKTVFDVTTAKGRTSAKSLAAKVSRSKTLIDEVGKEQNEERNRLNKEVNAVRNMAKDRLDALRDEIKKPVLDWERKEAERVRLHEINMDSFSLERCTGHDDSATIQGVLNAIEAIDVNESWEEYQEKATAAREAALVKYRSDLEVAKEREKQAEELEALRREKAEREEADRIRAQEEAEAKAKAEREQREAEEQKRREAEAKARAEEAAAQAEREAAEKIAAAERRAAEAAQVERDRIAAKEKADREAEEQRARDKKHRLKVRGEVVKALSELGAANYEEMVDAMIWGQIPHVKVSM